MCVCVSAPASCACACACACARACPRRCVRVSARAPPTQDLARKRLRETARPNYYLHMWGEAKYFQVSTLEHPPPLVRTAPGRVAPLPKSTAAARSVVRGIPASSPSPLVGFPLPPLRRSWDCRFLPFAASGIPASSYSPLAGFLLGCTPLGRWWDSRFLPFAVGGIPSWLHIAAAAWAASTRSACPRAPISGGGGDTQLAIYRSAAARSYI